MPHFDWTISLGSLLTVISLLALLMKVGQFHNTLLIEHEILVKDYCDRNGIEKHDLPTRGQGLSLFGWGRKDS